MKKIKNLLYPLFIVTVLTMSLSSCDDQESYSDLLNAQEKAVNWYLSNRQVELQLPADSISFQTGENAPFYKLDEDGSVYMQVISKGDLTSRPKRGDVVYFRYQRKDIKALYQGYDVAWDGNSDLTQAATSFIYGNQVLTSTTQWGEGIQWPLQFFGYNSEVNLVLKSLEGFVSDETTCTPYIINIKYYKALY